MTERQTALVVEDNALVAMDAREILANHGFDPIHVFNSAEFATSMVRGEPLAFALVVTHLHSGETAPLAAMLTDRRVPFGFVSDFVDGQDLPPLFRGHPFVTKPYSRGELAGLLAKLGLRERGDGAED